MTQRWSPPWRLCARDREAGYLPRRTIRLLYQRLRSSLMASRAVKRWQLQASEGEHGFLQRTTTIAVTPPRLHAENSPRSPNCRPRDKPPDAPRHPARHARRGWRGPARTPCPPALEGSASRGSCRGRDAHGSRTASIRGADAEDPSADPRQSGRDGRRDSSALRRRGVVDPGSTAPGPTLCGPGRESSGSVAVLPRLDQRLEIVGQVVLDEYGRALHHVLSEDR